MGNKRSGQVRTTASSGPNKTYIIVGAVIVAFVAGFIALVVLDSRQQAGSSPPGEVETYDVGPANEHTDGDVDYEQTPPTGGEHNPIWQNEGFYDAPVRDENAVHTMEHGAVWITFNPDLPQDQKDRIRGLVEGQTCMVASPHTDLPAPVVASAWGKQLTLESANSPDLERFVRAYRLGPQTQEVGATCSGGTGDTL
ncbi:MAG: DUF3105 domain-containing protein [Rubrobacter sp.]|nr:DUF3105 domain-containing protein [Rubrobacter sp.]MBA3950520.1 DUF3105 domain-containing protein [Rubrobacter sp.]MDQ3360256.1 DUF3105 domain-containing protein [Actinomycetota bacterium]